MSQNGKLKSSELSPITICANGQRAYLANDAARAFNAMNAESERRFNVTLKVDTPAEAYRTYAEQVLLYSLYKEGKGNLAAKPGTSNHGEGIAIDCLNQQMREIVDKIGVDFGWSKNWSDAPTEWWHIKWKAGNYDKAINNEKWFGYTAAEKRWITEYDRLKAANKGSTRRTVLRFFMKRQRQAIYRAAIKDGKVGWHKYNRIHRFNSLKARTS